MTLSLPVVRAWAGENGDVSLGQTNRMNKLLCRSLLWLALMGFTFVFFYFLIPDHIYNSSPALISFTGAVLFTVFFVLAIVAFLNWRVHATKDETKGTFPVLLGILIGFILIAMSMVFWMHFGSKESAELKLHGQKVTGVIIDGSSIESRHGGSYTVTVSFNTIDGRAMTVEESVGESDFKKLQTGQEVELLYSTKDPNMIELLINPEIVKDYTGGEEREITARDLLEILKTDSSSVSGLLKTINSGWNYQSEDSLWMNTRVQAAINLKTGSVRYVKINRPYFNINEFNGLGFRTESMGAETAIFDSEEYSVIANQKRDNNDFDKLTTIVTIRKK